LRFELSIRFHPPKGGLSVRPLVGSDSSIKEGIEHLQHSLEIFPDQPNLRFDLISALRKTGDYAAAGIQLRSLKDSLPSDNVRLEYTQGLPFADLGHPEAAAASSRQAHSPEAHYQLALSLQRAGRAEQASHEFAEVERLNQQRRSGSEMPKP
jgi:tetratricopeptide (TPR) repeat protein